MAGSFGKPSAVADAKTPVLGFGSPAGSASRAEPQQFTHSNNNIAKEENQTVRFRDNDKDNDIDNASSPQYRARSRSGHPSGVLSSYSDTGLGILDRRWISDYIRLLAQASGLHLQDIDIVRLAGDAEAQFGAIWGLQVTTKSIAPLQSWLAATFVGLATAEDPEEDWPRPHEHSDHSFREQDSSFQGHSQPQRIPSTQPSSTMIPQVGNTPMLGHFLNGVNNLAKAQNGNELAEWLQLEPEFNSHTKTVIAELKQFHPKGSEAALSDKCEKHLTIASNPPEDAPTWGHFPIFITRYLTYLRDLNTDNSDLLETYNLLIAVQEKVNSTLTHISLGYIMLPTVIRCAQIVCKLAIGLDKRPELIAHLKTAQSGDDDAAQKETLPERAANTLRAAFNTCLNDRELKYGPDGVPAGRKRGIYTLANISLKILFQCGKSRNASVIFENIGDKSPPLSTYPKHERITYLYYLGRYMFQNNHFYRAHQSLQAAYEECSTQSKHLRQRRRILIYLVTCNLIMGRFPSAALISTPEAQGFAERFGPIAQAMRSGDLRLFQQHLDFDGPNADWFLHWRILLPLRTRCEVHVWRSLVRKTYLLAGKEYDLSMKRPASLEIKYLRAAFALTMEKRGSWNVQESEYIDPDLIGTEPPHDSEDEDPNDPVPMNLVSILSSLVDQGFIRGGAFALRHSTFMLQGVRDTGSQGIAKAFPSPWSIVEAKADRELPGWAKTDGRGVAAGAGAGGGGMVVNLSGLKTIGS